MRRAFTIVELLGVMVIIMVLVAISVPAFSSLMRSSRASVADGSLRVALASARDAAVSSLDGGDAAAVFLFEPGGRVRVVVCSQVGRLSTLESDYAGRLVGDVDVFVPDPRYEAQELPANWLVRGLAPALTIANAQDTQPFAWYSSARYDHQEFNWVLPEDGFFKRDERDPEGYRRQTFMVRFDAQSGALDTQDQAPALVYLPSVDLRRTALPFRDYNPLRTEDHRRMVRRILTNTTAPQREQLLGDRATDTVLARPVAHVALYDVRELARKLRHERVGFPGVDKRTGSLYAFENNDATRRRAVFSPALAREVNRHLPAVADIFTFERYSGRPRRVPTREENAT